MTEPALAQEPRPNRRGFLVSTLDTRTAERYTFSMCNYENREVAMEIIERDPEGIATVWCDPCLTPLVSALNAGGVRTIASCCGHRTQPGVISLSDGRELVIMPDWDSTAKLPIWSQDA